MDYLSSLLSLDGIAIGNYDRVLADRDRTPLAPEDARLLMALHAEAETAATLVAVSASVANALAREDAPKPSPRSLTTFAPPDLALFSASAAQLMDAGFGSQLLPALQDLAARIALARQMSKAFVAEAGIKAKVPSVDPEALSDAWRKACGSAQTALKALKRELSQQGAPIPARQAVALLDLLEVAGRGLNPCVEADGCVIVPGWAERRQHKRQKVDLQAEASIGLSLEPVQIFDVSTGGMGLTGLKNPRRGDALTVKLASGRRLRGSVAWVAGSKAGMRFEQPIPPGDTLLCE